MHRRLVSLCVYSVYWNVYMCVIYVGIFFLFLHIRRNETRVKCSRIIIYAICLNSINTNWIRHVVCTCTRDHFNQKLCNHAMGERSRERLSDIFGERTNIHSMTKRVEVLKNAFFLRVVYHIKRSSNIEHQIDQRMFAAKSKLKWMHPEIGMAITFP